MKFQRNNKRLRIAIQKSGRLSEGSFELLSQCGIRVRANKTQLLYPCDNFPIDIMLVRDDDIADLVNNNKCDIGIVGINVLEEWRLGLGMNGKPVELEQVMPLGFARCCLSIAADKRQANMAEGCFNKLSIATSYPNILTDYCNKNNLSCRITTLSGSVEIAPQLGISDAICDLVSTGATLAANGLEEITQILKSEAVLIRQKSPLSAQQEMYLSQLLTRIKGALEAKNKKYIMFHLPSKQVDEITRLIPGCLSPTVMPLHNDASNLAVHAVCAENDFWDTIDKLKSVGARMILVSPLENVFA